MSIKNRFCPVKSLDGPLFCSLFYSSNVIQTFTFFKYDWSRLDIIDVGEGKWGEREKKASKNFYNLTIHNTGPLIGRGKKVKFPGILRDKFAEKAANFAGILQKEIR